MTKIQKIGISCFLLAQFFIYLLILFVDNSVLKYLEFTAVAIAFGASFLFFSIKDKTYLTHTALLFTVISDVFLVLCEPQLKTLSMITFSITQIMYAVRILMETRSKIIKIVHIILRVGLSLLVVAISTLVLKENTDFLSLISMFYFTNLALNVLMSFYNKDSSILFQIGLFLFMLCDLFVGFGQLEAYLAISETSLLYKMAHSSFNFIWLFYVPAQTLLAISITKRQPTRGKTQRIKQLNSKLIAQKNNK